LDPRRVCRRPSHGHAHLHFYCAARGRSHRPPWPAPGHCAWDYSPHCRPGSLLRNENPVSILPFLRCSGGCRKHLYRHCCLFAILAHWFERKRGLASGIAVSGMGLGTFLLVPLSQSLIAAYGWRPTFLILAGLVLVIALPLNLFFLKHRPEELGLRVDGLRIVPAIKDSGPQPEAFISPQKDWTLKQVVRTRSFWPWRRFRFRSHRCLRRGGAQCPIHGGQGHRPHDGRPRFRPRRHELLHLSHFLGMDLRSHRPRKGIHRGDAVPVPGCSLSPSDGFLRK